MLVHQTSAYVSIRQHTSAYASMYTWGALPVASACSYIGWRRSMVCTSLPPISEYCSAAIRGSTCVRQHTDVSIRQHTAYVRIEHTLGYSSAAIRGRTSSCDTSISTHTSAYSIQHTSGYSIRERMAGPRAARGASQHAAYVSILEHTPAYRSAGIRKHLKLRD